MEKKEKQFKEMNKTHKAYQYDFTYSLGPWTSYSYIHDPIHLVFVLSRYKFVSKILKGKKKVLEIGCGDAIGLPIVAQHVGEVKGIDIDRKIIESDKTRLKLFNNIFFEYGDFLKSPSIHKYDGIYSVDVIEHIPPSQNDLFIENMMVSLKDNGIGIIGTPNIFSEKYASEQSRLHHVNLHSQESLKKNMEKFFKNVIMFGMNDEVIHTGFSPMCHYIWAVGTGVKNEKCYSF